MPWKERSVMDERMQFVRRCDRPDQQRTAECGQIKSSRQAQIKLGG